MKKVMIILIGACLLMSSCGNYEAAGMYTGSTFGNMIGSAIGGIAGGWRGHEIGALIGTVGGAAAGAAIGAAKDREQQQRYQEGVAARRQAQRQREATRSGSYGSYGQGQQGYGQGQGYDQSGYDPQMRGDDRITFDDGNATAQGYGQQFAESKATEPLVIRNAGVYEETRDGQLTRGEKCSVIFEIANNSSQPIYDIYPLVEESTGNRHIHISPNLRIESIAPHQAIRYTASLVADRGLRNGQIEVRVGVAQGNNVIHSQTRQFFVPTTRRVADSARR